MCLDCSENCACWSPSTLGARPSAGTLMTRRGPCTNMGPLRGLMPSALCPANPFSSGFCIPCPYSLEGESPWRCHDTETLSTILAHCEGKPQVSSGGFPSQTARNAEIWCFLCCYPNKLMNKQSVCQWFQIPWGSCRCYCQHIVTAMACWLSMYLDKRSGLVMMWQWQLWVASLPWSQSTDHLTHSWHCHINTHFPHLFRSHLSYLPLCQFYQPLVNTYFNPNYLIFYYASFISHL